MCTGIYLHVVDKSLITNRSNGGDNILITVKTLLFVTLIYFKIYHDLCGTVSPRPVRFCIQNLEKKEKKCLIRSNSFEVTGLRISLRLRVFLNSISESSFPQVGRLRFLWDQSRSPLNRYIIMLCVQRVNLVSRPTSLHSTLKSSKIKYYNIFTIVYRFVSFSIKIHRPILYTRNCNNCRQLIQVVKLSTANEYRLFVNALLRYSNELC